MVALLDISAELLDRFVNQLFQDDRLVMLLIGRTIDERDRLLT
jgi:hypothetical protein